VKDIVLHKDINITIKKLLSWCLFVAASVAIVKSRDLHWGLLAQKDHKDINLASVRMLLVADGANPCEFCQHPISCFPCFLD